MGDQRWALPANGRGGGTGSSPFPVWTTSSCDWQWAEALAGLKPGPGHWHQKCRAW